VRTPRPSAATVRRWREALQAIAGSDVWGVGPEAIRLARAALDEAAPVKGAKWAAFAESMKNVKDFDESILACREAPLGVRAAMLAEADDERRAAFYKHFADMGDLPVSLLACSEAPGGLAAMLAEAAGALPVDEAAEHALDRLMVERRASMKTRRLERKKP
jgi:hypothetical protein